MYRERKNIFTLPAGTMVSILKHGPKQTLVGLPKQFNGWMTVIPNEALPAFRGAAQTEKPAVAVKKPVRKAKTVKPVVAREPEIEQAL